LEIDNPNQLAAAIETTLDVGILGCYTVAITIKLHDVAIACDAVITFAITIAFINESIPTAICELPY